MEVTDKENHPYSDKDCREMHFLYWKFLGGFKFLCPVCEVHRTTYNGGIEDVPEEGR